MKTFIIAEAGVNHNGSIEQAIALVDAALEAKVDAVKFQTFKADSLVTKSAQTAEYQKASTHEKSQYELLKNLELNFGEHQQIFNYCHKNNIEFMSTPFDLKSVELLEELGVQKYKVSSGDLTNLPLLKAIAATQKPIILSTGMSNLEEVRASLGLFDQASLNQISLLHANTEYPTPYQDVHLKAMQTLSNTFSLPIGYSDHSLGIEVPIAAVALGATIIEKHFTLDQNQVGPDHQASLNPKQLKDMVSAIRNIELALGQTEKRASPSESKNIPIARKSIVAACHISKGEIFNAENLTCKRPGTGISPMQWNELIGTPASRDYKQDELI